MIGAFSTSRCSVLLLFSEVRGKSEATEHNLIFSTKPQAALARNRGLVDGSRFSRTSGIACRKCGKSRNPRARRLLRAKKPQVEALRHSGVLGMFRICRILPNLASVTGFVHWEKQLDNGHNGLIRLRALILVRVKLPMSAIGTSVCVGYGFHLLTDGFLGLDRLRCGCHGHRRADHGRARDRAEQVVKGSFHSGASR